MVKPQGLMVCLTPQGTRGSSGTTCRVAKESTVGFILGITRHAVSPEQQGSKVINQAKGGTNVIDQMCVLKSYLTNRTKDFYRSFSKH